MQNGHYGHPYTPYDVQMRFMDALYDTLQNKRVGIFESPTGTGKTLSLLGPSVAWLRDAAKRALQSDLDALDASDGPAWSIRRAKEMRNQAFDNEQHSHKELIAAAKRAVHSPKSLPSPAAKRQRRPETAPAQPAPALKQFLLEDQPLPSVADALALWSDQDAAIKQSQTAEAETTESLEPLIQPQKVFFASRTHSQLAQVADALASLRLEDPPRFITLGSRKQLCIHPEVTRLANVNQMNEKCTDLQKHSQCEHRKNTSVLRNQALGEIMDIEDLVKFGKAASSCPYYATREVLPYAEVVALPYPLLLVDRNRTALGIDVSDSVVIIDEAHNLVDTITSLNSASISNAMVSRSLKSLQVYMARVGSRLSPSNRRNVAQIIKLLESLAAFFATLSTPVKPGTQVDVRQLFAHGNADTLDIQRLSDFAQSSKLVYKVDSYAQYVAEQDLAEAATHPTSKTGARGPDSLFLAVATNSLGSLMDFLLLANDPLAEGKLFLDFDDPAAQGNSRVVLRYLLLDPSLAFRSVVDDAKAVVLAGGTMEPVTDFTRHLLPYVSADEQAIHAYGHIVPKTQLMTMAVSSLQFTFANRSNPKVISELGKITLDVCSNTPNGVVVFFPGYSYLAQVVGAWRKTGVYSQIEQHKRIFWESNNPAHRDPDIFAKYSRAAVASKGTGAVLFAVVGGRLSEGINFSDSLARAVIMVGIPFPNAFSAEMVAKRAYIESATRAAGGTEAEAKDQARQYYENLAMRAVNQSVGRAIRHIKDFAAIYLIDDRYKQSRVAEKLSRWVRESIVPPSTALVPATREFFARNA